MNQLSRRTNITHSISAFFLVLTPLAVSIASKSLVILFALATIFMVVGSWKGRAHFKSLFNGPNPWPIRFGLTTAFLLLCVTIIDAARGGANFDDALQMLVMLLLLLLWPLFNSRVTDSAIWFVPAFITSFVIAFIYVQMHLWLDIDLFTIFHSENKIEALWVFNNAIVALVLFSWVFVPPASAALKPVFGLVVVLLAWFLSFFSESESAVFGMVCGLTVYLISRFISKKINLVVFGGMSLLLIGAPWFFLWASEAYLTIFDFLRGSDWHLSITLAERAELWVILHDRIFETPRVVNTIFGHGVDFLKQNKIVPEGSPYATVKTGLIHPHSIFMQAWLDGGILLMLALLSFIAMIASLMPRANTHMAFAALGLFVSGIFIALVTHSLFSDWWFANLALAGIVYKTFNESLTT